jgi:hypothetical protein
VIIDYKISAIHPEYQKIQILVGVANMRVENPLIRAGLSKK